MARITLGYDERNVKDKKILEFLLSFGTFKKVAPENAVEISLEEVRTGKVTKHKSVKDYFQKIAK